MVQELRKVTDARKYDVVTIGYPGRVLHNAPVKNPPNLGFGLVGYDFKRVFKKPLKILNDAAMQALGSYLGGRMLFLGLGTGLGSTLILDGVVHATEIGDLPYCDNRSYGDYLGSDGLERMGKPKWVRHVKIAVRQLKAALQVEYVVLGGGKAKLVSNLPAGVVRGDNSKAFDGGLRAWKGFSSSNGRGFSFI